MRRKRQTSRASDSALQRIDAALRTIPADQVVHVNLDVPRAIAIVSQSVAAVRSLEAQLVVELPLFDRSVLDALGEYARALGEAHTLCETYVRAPEISEIGRRARSLRTKLLTSAQLLAAAGLVPAAPFDKNFGANGYENTARDLERFAVALKGSWPLLQGKTLLTPADLDAAAELALLLREKSSSEQTITQRAKAYDLRDRAYTLTFRAYREVRRAVCYLREPFSDADAYAPSLHPGRPGARISRALGLKTTDA